MNSILDLQVFTGLRLHRLVVRPQLPVSSARTPLTFSHPLHFIDALPHYHHPHRPDLKTPMHKTCHTVLVLLLGG